MVKYLKKKIAFIKLYILFIIFACISWILFLFKFSSLEFKTAYPILFLLSAFIIVLLVIYRVFFYYLIGNFKHLKSIGLEHIADDIDLSSPTLKMSKIYCGKDAFFHKMPFVVIPYSEIAWVYPMSGGHNETCFYMNNGKKYILKTDKNEIQHLIDNYIFNPNTNTIVGYGTNETKAFLNMYSPTLKKHLHKNIIWGLIIIVFSIVITIIGVIKNTFDSASIMVVALIFLLGLFLLLKGTKYTEIRSGINNLKHKFQTIKFYDVLFKITTITNFLCLALIMLFGYLNIEIVLYITLILYLISLIPLLCSKLLNTGFFKNKEGYNYSVPFELIDDLSYIDKIHKDEFYKNDYIYTILFDTKIYGWSYMLDSADYIKEFDLKKVYCVCYRDFNIQSSNNSLINNVTESYYNNNLLCSQTPELETEHATLIIKGFSAKLKNNVEIIWHNQTKIMQIITNCDDNALIERYVETLVRHNFGTEDEMKRAKIHIKKHKNTED